MCSYTTNTYATKGSVIDMEEDTNEMDRELNKAYNLGMVPVVRLLLLPLSSCMAS